MFSPKGNWSNSALKAGISSDQDNARLVIVAFFLCFTVGIVAVVYQGWSYWAVGVLWALASCGSGAAIGFLFGIPRTPGPAQPPVSAALGPTGANNAAKEAIESNQQVVNTNLVEVSDWLTKVIVGVGLVQMKSVPGYIQSMGEELARNTNGYCSRAFAEGILIYFSVIGFLTGYLLTRLFLQTAFAAVDRLLAEKRALQQRVEGAAESEQIKGDLILAMAKQQQSPPPGGTAAASPDSIGQLNSLLDDYNRLLREQNPSRTRTSAMNEIVARMISLSPYPSLFDYKTSLQDRANPGKRLAAFVGLYFRPDPIKIDELLKSLTSVEDSPFGQFWAIQALKANLARVNAKDLDPSVIEQLREFQRQLPPGTARLEDLTKLLDSLAS